MESYSENCRSIPGGQKGGGDKTQKGQPKKEEMGYEDDRLFKGDFYGIGGFPSCGRWGGVGNCVTA